MIQTDDAKPGMKVIINVDQPNRRDGPIYPGRRGELVRPNGRSMLNWYVWIYAQGKARERMEVFDLAELTVDLAEGTDGKIRRFLRVSNHQTAAPDDPLPAI